MLDLSEAARQFPDDPDWTWLAWFWAPGGLFRQGLTLEDIAADAAGRLACLATPYARYDGGPVLAADIALEWMAQLGRVGILPLAPAYLADEAGAEVADPVRVLNYADLVIIPLVPGWRRSACVWRAACCALDRIKPVYVLNGGEADG
ncbi:hypothetical protein [Leisingera caerulea]|uniref:hypothetical protein n=1 Tax=Leisingera caerulea TaxID=506591 RepID=UPI003F4AF204